MKCKDMKYWYAWRPVATDKGVRWLETVGIKWTAEERELYPWYPGCMEPPTFQATVRRYICLRSKPKANREDKQRKHSD